MKKEKNYWSINSRKLDDIVVKARQFKPSGSDAARLEFYKGTYPVIVAWCSQKSTAWRRQDWLVLLCMTYSWMPRIPTQSFGSDYHEHSDKQWSEIKNDCRSCLNSHTAVSFLERHFPSGKPPFAGSWIGTSKMLHFINPDVFPIWDSKIAKAGCVNSGENKLRHYKTYVEQMHNHLKNQNLKTTLQATKDKLLLNDLGDLRALEFCIFVAGKR